MHGVVQAMSGLRDDPGTRRSIISIGQCLHTPELRPPGDTQTSTAIERLLDAIATTKRPSKIHSSKGPKIRPTFRMTTEARPLPFPTDIIGEWYDAK